MERKFERALLLCVKKYSLYNSLMKVLEEISFTAKGFDIREHINSNDIRFHTQIFRFPYKIRVRWENYFLNKVNRIIINEIEEYKPDLLMVYNSEFLLPETCATIRKRTKLIFFMGDSPFYTYSNSNYLPCLMYADLILAPDTYWLGQLNMLGLKQTAFFVPDIDFDSYNIITNENVLNTVQETDVFYTGTSYPDSWGYKKALLMSRFTGFNFKLYGNATWKRWFGFFPELKEHYTQRGYIPTAELNIMFNRTKLIPVDGNPAILNGFHLRLLEALGAGALPLIEYRKDIGEILFKDCNINLPIITDYRNASDRAQYYLNNETERKETVYFLRNYISNKYNSKKNGERISDLLKS